MEDKIPLLDSLQAQPMWVGLALGGALLLFGRKLYFLVLGAAGFGLGWTLVSRLEVAGPDWLQIAAGIGGGVVAATLAFLLHKAALVVGGAVLGGFAGLWGMETFALDWGGAEWAVPAGGALVGAIALSAVFRYALIGASSWLGSALLVGATSLEGTTAGVATLALMIGGAWFQLNGSGAEEPEASSPPAKEERRRRRLLRST